MKNRIGFRLLSLLVVTAVMMTALPTSGFGDEIYRDTYAAGSGIQLITGTDMRIVPAPGTLNAPYLYPGETMHLQVEPADIYTASAWESSDDSVAVIDSSGLVTAVSPGAVVITVEETHGYRQEYQVVVLNRETTYTVTYRITYPEDAYTYVFRKDDGHSKPDKPQDTSFTEEYTGLIPGSTIQLNNGNFVQAVNYTLSDWKSTWGTLYKPGAPLTLSGNVEMEAIFSACTLPDETVEDKVNYYKKSDNQYLEAISGGLRFRGSDGKEYFKFMVAANEQINTYYKNDFKKKNFSTKLIGFKLDPEKHKDLDQALLNEQFSPGQLIDLPYRESYYFLPVFADENVLNTVVVIRKKGTLSASYGYSSAYYYYVGQGMLTQKGAEVIEAQTDNKDTPWGTKGIDGGTDEKHYYSVGGYTGTVEAYTTNLAPVDGEPLYDESSLPSMQQIMAAVGETISSADAYRVIWYKIGRTGKGYTLDGVLQKVNEKHVITVIDTVTGNIAGQLSVDDLTVLNLNTYAKNLKCQYSNFEYSGAYTQRTGGKAVKDEEIAIDMDFEIYLRYKSTDGKNYYTVRFLDENGDDTYFISPGIKGSYYQRVARSAQGEKAPEPVKPGYTFRGWYTEKNGNGQRLDKQLDKVIKDWTFYAFFTRDTAELTIRKDAPALTEGAFDIRVFGFAPGEEIGPYTASEAGAITLSVRANSEETLTVPAGTYRVNEKLLLQDAVRFDVSYPGSNTVTLKDGEKATVTVLNKPVIRIGITGNRSEFEYDGTLKSAEGYEFACADPLFDPEKLSFSGKALVSETEAGDYPMGLKATDFNYEDDRVKAVFIILDGLLTITPVQPEPPVPPDPPVSETTLASVQIVWDDANDADRVRPAQLATALLADSVSAGNAVISADTGWRATLTGLPLRAENGADIAYAWSVDTPEQYTLVSQVTTGTTTTFTFRHVIPTITLSVRKQWEDNNNANGTRPDSLTVYLYGSGAVYGQVTLSAANSWQASLQAPQRVNGQTVDYQWIEPAVNGYTSEGAETEGSETVLINRIIPAQQPANPQGGEATHTLTVLYRDTEGNEVATPAVQELATGGEYSIPSPEINGFITLEPLVTGVMPDRDVTHTVLYLRNQPGQKLLDLGDYETPLGLGDVYVNVGEAFE